MYNFYGNELPILQIKKWLRDFKNKKKGLDRAIYVRGPSGVGKTSIIKHILKENDYPSVEYNSSQFRNKDFINTTIKSNMRTFIFSFNGVLQKNAIIIDEIESLMICDRGSLGALIQLINSNDFLTPIICIGNTKNSRLNDFMKKCYYVEFYKIVKKDMGKILDQYLNLEKIKISLNDKKKIIQCSNGDVSHLINLVNINKNSKNVQAKKENEKDKNYDLYQITKKLLYNEYPKFNYLCIERYERLYQMDITVSPLMIHENIFDNTTNFTNTNNNESTAIRYLYSTYF